MELRVRHTGHVAVVDVAGKITIGNGDAVFRERVLELLENEQKHILLNLEKVSYMDSGGIVGLIACYKHAKEKRGFIKLLNPSRRVHDLLEVTGLKQVFETFNDEDEALDSFGS